MLHRLLLSLRPLLPAEALADENALAAVPAVSASFDELVLAFKKEVHVNIITAHVSSYLFPGAPLL